MRPYIKIYFDYFGYDESSFIPCEVCGAKSVEIHHIRPKSLAKRWENKIGNLAALCRVCHDDCHGPHSRTFTPALQLIHRKLLLKFSNNEDDRIIFSSQGL